MLRACGTSRDGVASSASPRPGAVAAVVAVATFLAVGSSGVTPGVESAEAAFAKAAKVTAASAEQSGTATVDMTHDGQLWAHKIVRWKGRDAEISDSNPGHQSGYPLTLVDGMMYGHDPSFDGWVELGSPATIDPDRA